LSGEHDEGAATSAAGRDVQLDRDVPIHPVGKAGGFVFFLMTYIEAKRSASGSARAFAH